MDKKFIKVGHRRLNLDLIQEYYDTSNESVISIDLVLTTSTGLRDTVPFLTEEEHTKTLALLDKALVRYKV